MVSLIAVIYVAAVAALVRFVLGRGWRLAVRVQAVLALVLALPLALLAMLVGEPTESAGWGAGLVLVTVAPANVLAAAVGTLWFALRRGRPG